jgi:hypothetical protein
LHEEPPEESIFDWSTSTLQKLNDGCKELPVLPIQYLFEFCDVTGHGLQLNAESIALGLDILTGGAATSRSIPSNTIDPVHCEMLAQLISQEIKSAPAMTRRILVGKLVDYIETHIIPGKKIQSLEILQMIMQEPQ